MKLLLPAPGPASGQNHLVTYRYTLLGGFPAGPVIKNPPAKQEMQVDP